MRRLNTIALVALASFALAACGAPQAATPTTAPAAPAATEAPAAPAATEAPAALSYAIDPARSEALFVLNEELLGQPTTVTGTSTIVSGIITADWASPANTQVGTIEIDANSLTTDRDQRNGAIRRFILQTDQFPKITFEPTAIEGLPDAVNAGDALTFKVTGNLTVRNVTKPVTFDVTTTAVSEDEISGTAKANVTRTDFELTIPSVPNVANVTDEVTLALNFVATKQ